jgi:hypothetical protein
MIDVDPLWRMNWKSSRLKVGRHVGWSGNPTEDAGVVDEGNGKEVTVWGLKSVEGSALTLQESLFWGFLV